MTIPHAPVTETYDGSASFYATVSAPGLKYSLGGRTVADDMGVRIYADEETGQIDRYDVRGELAQPLTDTLDVFIPWQAGPIVAFHAATNWPAEVA